MNAARTGLTEEQARAAGFRVVSVLCVTDDKAHYYPDSAMFVTKLIADGETARNFVAGRMPAARMTISAGRVPVPVCTPVTLSVPGRWPSP